MTHADALTRENLRTPKAAAIAGMLFSLLTVTIFWLLWNSVPADPQEPGLWLTTNSHAVTLGLNLVPFAGIAFLWFMGVVRDRMGHLEDQFFSTVFFGSGLLFLAMTFVSAALAGGVLATYAVAPSKLIDSGVYLLVRTVMFRITNVYAIRMAGVFMISLGTIWVRTRLMPRWLAFLTYAVALGLLLSISSHPWVLLIFPAWVCVVSVYILASNLNTPTGEAANQVVHLPSNAAR